MKVTYNSPHFYIDGVQIINPDFLTKFFYTKDVLGELLYYTKDGLLKDGDSFELPDNIIAEKEDSASGLFEVYRLKLKEPLVELCNHPKCGCGDEYFKICIKPFKLTPTLVDTGSKESSDRILDDFK